MLVEIEPDHPGIEAIRGQIEVLRARAVELRTSASWCPSQAAILSNTAADVDAKADALADLLSLLAPSPGGPTP